MSDWIRCPKCGRCLIQYSSTKGTPFVLPLEEIELICFNWGEHKGKHTIYLKRQFRKNGKVKSRYLHREILHTPKGKLTDHIDGNGLNNCYCNLRVVDDLTNCRNKHWSNQKTTSKFVGVSFYKGKYNSSINVNNKKIYLGRFETEMEAFNARLKAEKKYWGNTHTTGRNQL
jgi:hypothetical protein